MRDEFKSLFQWDGHIIEDVRFWCEPEATSKALQEISNMGFPSFGAIATFEARGFYLAGVAAEQFKLPTLLIRKHKRFYDKMDHQRIDFKNWKGEAESLTILKKSMPNAKKVLIIDDIFDTGNSLRAGVTLLNSLNVEPVGAFYLLNAGTEDSLKDFSFPIKSILKQKLF